MTARATALLLLPLAACNGRASAEDCAKLKDHYIALVTADPAVAKMTPEQQSVAREVTLSLRSGEKTWQRVSRSCEATVTEKQADCAIAATTADAWETCLK
jgi:hypothetical protein